ncbi:MAG: hypothetical protein LBB50_00690, partial [Oscillospiraceae bacterium]|nr:hypothetical protein [Oscillospiraceae bacterium]
MKPRKQKRSPKKKAAAAVAVLLALALSMGGTYMFLDHSQHKTNEAMGDLPAYDVRLVEEFEEVSGWKTTDPPLKKEIRVANVGKASDGFSGVYVRLQLKEYMEIAPLTYTQTAERYMMAQDGKFVVFESRAAAEAAYPGRIVTELTDAVAKTTGWFVQTKAHDSDGQYGKFVVTEITRGAASSLVEGVARADRDAAEKHQENTNGECAYTVHTWNGEVDGSYYNGKTMFPGLSDAGALTFHDFVQWQLGGNGDNLISLTDFLNPVGNNGAPVSKWIYDDRVVGVGTNWVYWGRLLEPQNNEESNPNSTTSNLLEKIRLLLQPQGSFYYAIHVDMQALSLDELGGTNKKWTDAPEGIINSYISHAP